MRSELLTAADLRAFGQGTELRAYEKLGARILPASASTSTGVAFAVWAPEAARVSVIGDFNGWSPDAAPLARLGDTGVWQGVVPGAARGHRYKYRIVSRHDGHVAEKADPYGLLHESPPHTASIVTDLAYDWNDGAWMASRAGKQSLAAPMSIYEVHLGSWKRARDDGFRSLHYREIAPQLADYVARMGFTHVELMPVMEHPFFGSWGYQVTGYFAPSHRYGTAQDFMFLVETLHQRGIGVILDWVPAHFPTDAHGLGFFDGTHLYEHADPRQGFHPEWNSFIFNYARNEVRSFLFSSALFWLERYHADALRVDGVSSMLQLDYARKPGEWIPNVHGGRENLAAISLLRELNESIYREQPDVQVIAEEATSWPLVSKPTTLGGLGFGLKWDMGWMHDTLDYLAHPPAERKHHHDRLTFRSIYAFTENFVLPLSHDEVVYGKRSLLAKMPGSDEEKRANLRLLLSYMWATPGKKLLFMGGELGQWQEWNHDGSLDLDLLNDPAHGSIARLVGSLNHLHRSEPALHQRDTEASGFEWIDGSNAAQSVLTFLRRGENEGDAIVVCLNFGAEVRPHYRVGVPRGGTWREVLNSDAIDFGGRGRGNLGRVTTAPVPWNGRRWSMSVTIPPLAAVFFKGEGEA